MSERSRLAPYAGQDVFCLGKIEKFLRGGGNNMLNALLTQVRIEDTIAFDHLWLRVGLPDYLFTRFKEGEWISFYATVWMYTRADTGATSYSLAYLKDIVRSYS